ncbi:hypothetical protein BOW53_04485 [Solemya pervernicosa gill symbiont]|uniref:Uncharacterized protein n=1 Tax=Solemya pervernicosa gill symbiont TaxID=642797 RepID=A0A1T2L860_9GAMM|nr:hypothetical protein [Solemya pervernicosa gill symbiont]OOZ41242.1 hypothetical protein BOW53_04485 [Solemya pervernicosa gill symbiont]
MTTEGGASLLSGESPSLALWYAEPMSQSEAEVLFKRAQQAQRTALIHATSPFLPRLTALLASFWLGGYEEDEWLQMAQLASSEYEQVLVELLQGQLLVSRKLSGALHHLKSAFMKASNLLEAEGYFEVLKRHEVLACLPTAPHPAEPLGLEALLTEAAVIQRMGGCTAMVPKREPIDTVG